MTDDEHSGRPVKLDDDQLNNLIHENLHQLTTELGEQSGCHYKIVLNHLHSMGKVKKLGSWVPHSLSEKNKLQHSMIAAECLPVKGLIAQKKTNFFTAS